MKKLLFKLRRFLGYRPQKWNKIKREFLNLFRRYRLSVKIIDVKRDMTYSYIKIPLKDIYTSNRYITKIINDTKYDWDKLKEDIKEYGLKDPLTISQKIRQCEKTNKIYRYVLMDGNHRYTILKELYSSEYVVDVKLYNNLRLEEHAKKEWIKRGDYYGIER
tara:strand:+ start:8369 stop:8854 length:486 start_codon:yes stop_codon:yes gene_type:complete